MPSYRQIQQQRRQILAALIPLEQIRRGTLTEQMVESVGRDGLRRQRGPYMLYTFKEGGRTVSRRITDPTQVPIYRHQIRQWRRFQELTAQLLRLGEALSEQVLEAAAKKTSKPPSKRKSKPDASFNA